MLFDLAKQMEAYKMLNSEVGGQLGAEQIYKLCKEAGYGEAAAKKAMRQRANERLDAKMPMN